MRKAILLFAMFAALTLQAQDIIVMKDGSTILSKILEVNVSDIKYKKFSNLDGPTYTIEKAGILAINYENGDKDTFENASEENNSTTNQSSNQRTIDGQPDARNAELIALYNRPHDLSPDVAKNGKKAKHGCFIIAVDEKSTLSTPDIEIRFVQEPYLKHISGTMFAYYFLTSKYIVQVFNKTDNAIYLDMGNTFRVLADGTSKVYYDINQTTISQGSTTGGSMNLGGVSGGLLSGVSIGGGVSGSTSKTYAKQRVLAVPPHGKIPLEVYQQAHVKGKHYETITEGENSIHWFLKGGEPQITCGEKISYDVNSSPFRTQYTIRYSLDENFTTINTISGTIYMKDLYGLKDNDWANGKGSPEKLINNVKEIIPDYDEYTLVGPWYTTSSISGLIRNR